MAFVLASSSFVYGQNVKKVKIIGHRGASFHAPENTVASAILGWKHNADAVEIDIHLSADKKIMVSHDASTKRITGQDYKIESTSSETIRTLDAGVWKGEEYKGEKIPFLKEILEVLPRKKQLVIEIKSSKEIVPYLKEELEESEKVKQIILISFDFEALAEAKKAMPELPAYFLSSKVMPESFPELVTRLHENKIDGLNLNDTTITGEIADLCKKNRVPLFAWTVDDADTARKLIAMGVTAITTNKPLEMRDWLGM
jgi:glycerophosphoryl diester phosphodiesterase